MIQAISGNGQLMVKVGSFLSHLNQGLGLQFPAVQISPKCRADWCWISSTITTCLVPNNFPRYELDVWMFDSFWIGKAAKLLRPRFLYRIGEGGGIAEVTMMAFGGYRYRETKRLKESWHGCLIQASGKKTSWNFSLIRVSVIFGNSNHDKNSPRLYHNALLAVKSLATRWILVSGPQSPLGCLCCSDDGHGGFACDPLRIWAEC